MTPGLRVHSMGLWSAWSSRKHCLMWSGWEMWQPQGSGGPPPPAPSGED